MTGVGAAVFATIGFFGAAFVSAWMARAGYAEPWRKLRIEQQGIPGKPQKTRVVFSSPALVLQTVEVLRDGEGAPREARAWLRDGEEIAVRYDAEGRPHELEGPDGARARLDYEGKKMVVTFFSAAGAELGARRMTPPLELDVATKTARASTGVDVEKLAGVLRDLGDRMVGTAHAEEPPPESMSLTRELPVRLTLRLDAKDKPGRAQLEASCLPFACVATPLDVDSPGTQELRIAVTGTTKRSTLPKSAGAATFEDEAKEERRFAKQGLPHAARVVSALGVTAMACETAAVDLSVCVRGFGKNPAIAGGAIRSIVEHAVESDRGVLDQRAAALEEEERVRAALDANVKVELCASRDGFARVCTSFAARPFGPGPSAAVDRALDLKRGVGGTLVGSFVVTQADGADCKFSPSPRTSGTLRLTFDNDKSTVTAAGSATERGARPNVQCSLGTANMGWSQSYTLSATQTLTKEQMQAGGKMALRLVGTMNGTGSFDFSNCRSGGGAVACPGGRNEGYGYPVEIVGTIDVDTRTGSGQILINNAPLPTTGTWRTPAEPKP